MVRAVKPSHLGRPNRPLLSLRVVGFPPKHLLRSDTPLAVFQDGMFEHISRTSFACSRSARPLTRTTTATVTSKRHAVLANATQSPQSQSGFLSRRGCRVSHESISCALGMNPVAYVPRRCLAPPPTDVLWTKQRECRGRLVAAP